MWKKALTYALVAAFYVALWQIASIAVGQRLILPAPGAVLATLGELSRQGPFWAAVGASLLSVLAGYLGGLALGVVAACLCHGISPLRVLVRPMMSVIRATPVASFIILAFFVLSRGYVPGFMSFLMVLPIVFANVLEGLDQTDRKLLEMARLFRLGRPTTWWRVRVPAALPYAVTAAATTLGMAWKAGIAAEVIGNAGISIGAALRDSRSSLDSPALFAWTLVVIALSMLLELLLRAALKRASLRMGAAGIGA